MSLASALRFASTAVKLSPGQCGMADATATLRTARGALQEGLITDADYEAVKAAFLKAQQFKAGLDAGFITEADYNDVKSRFLDAFYGLNVSGDGGSSGYPSPARPSSPALAPGSPAGASATHTCSRGASLLLNPLTQAQFRHCTLVTMSACRGATHVLKRILHAILCSASNLVTPS